ncbi:Hypothetical protein FKW44_013068, partial [Caligus rogercresseyi]
KDLASENEAEVIKIKQYYSQGCLIRAGLAPLPKEHVLLGRMKQMERCRAGKKEVRSLFDKGGHLEKNPLKIYTIVKEYYRDLYSVEDFIGEPSGNCTESGFNLSGASVTVHGKGDGKVLKLKDSWKMALEIKISKFEIEEYIKGYKKKNKSPGLMDFQWSFITASLLSSLHY